MQDEIKRGTRRIKVDEIQIIDPNIQRIISDTLINNGYDIDIEPIEPRKIDPYIPRGMKINIYEVGR